jgi:hypothetical protein
MTLATANERTTVISRSPPSTPRLRMESTASRRTLLTAICGNDRVDLLVVPPHTATGTADAALVVAATTSNLVHAQHILLAAVTPHPSRVDGGAKTCGRPKAVTSVPSRLRSGRACAGRRGRDHLQPDPLEPVLPLERGVEQGGQAGDQDGGGEYSPVAARAGVGQVLAGAAPRAARPPRPVRAARTRC